MWLGVQEINEHFIKYASCIVRNHALLDSGSLVTGLCCPNVRCPLSSSRSVLTVASQPEILCFPKTNNFKYWPLSQDLGMPIHAASLKEFGLEPNLSSTRSYKKIRIFTAFTEKRC